MAAPARQTIAHYQILEKLGEGGMGVVYKARDTRLERLVALKFLTPRLAQSAEARERFLREARTISALNHPHIAVIHEIGEHNGEIFLVFEYLPGGSLRARRPKNLAEAFTFAVQLAEALAAAHRHGVVHRDVKPGNVLFTEDHTLKLADFGLAREASDPHVTSAGMAVGTPAYMAPELFRGHEADTRSDVYSLGVVIYELFAGKLPRPEFALEIPLQARPVLERALDADPCRRYASASEMASDLRSAAVLLASGSRIETVTLQQPRPRRLPAAAIVVVLAASLLVNHDSVDRNSGRAANRSTDQLVVLPFDSHGAAAWRIFCDGLTYTVSSALTALESLPGSVHVVPAGVVRAQAVTSPSDAWKLLGARLAVIGDVQPETSGLRVTVAVLDTRTMRRIAVSSASFAPQDLPSLQDWAVGRVARMMAFPTRPEPRTQTGLSQTRESAAYESYVLGRGYLSHYDVPEDLANAVAAFRNALQRDPSYALAHAGMAEALWRTWKTTREPQWLEQAEASALRARRLHERLAPVYIILARIANSRGRYDEAVQNCRRALELEPLNPEAHSVLAGVYQSMGRPADAEAAYRQAIELRPGEWSGYNNLAAFYTEQSRLPEAERLFQQMIALTPEGVLGYQNLGGVYLRMGRYTEACAALERALALKPTAASYSNLGIAYYYEGRYTEAAAAMQKAVDQRPADFILWGNLGDAYRLAPGHQARATQSWRRAAELAEGELAMNPADVRARTSLALYQAQTGNCARALAGMERARRSGSLTPPAMWKAARVYEFCGRRLDALEALRLALQAGESPENIRREPEFAALRQDLACAQILPKEDCHEPNNGPRPARSPGH